MRTTMSALLTILLVAVLGVSLAHAGAKLKINDDAMIDLGARVQTLYLNMGDEFNAEDGEFDRYDFFKIRRARLRVKLVASSHMTGFIQTDVGDFAGSGQDMRVIDAWINTMYNDWLQLYTGLNMAPALRQNVTSSGALMAVDRPGMAYKPVSWGIRSRYAFTNATIGATDLPGLGVDGAVRDIGATLFGSGPVGENVHLKYYVGMYNGTTTASGEDTERYTGRVQVNFGDAEAGYFNSSTYLGKKNTIGIGASIDMQSEVLAMPTPAKQAADETGDYMLYSVDAFIEKQLGEGGLTAEAGFIALDLDDLADNVSGTGFYGQLGYLIQDTWQPWALYETWSSDADNDAGNYNLWRIGLSYYLAGHNANIKAGFEQVSQDNPFAGDEDSISSFVLGFFTTY